MKDLFKMMPLGIELGLAATLLTMLVGCASKGWLPPTNMDGQYHTATVPESYKKEHAGLAVLVGRNARVEGDKLIYGCFYQSDKGVVRIDQSYECEAVRKL